MGNTDPCRHKNLIIMHKILSLKRRKVCMQVVLTKLCMYTTCAMVRIKLMTTNILFVYSHKQLVAVLSDKTDV